MCVCVSRTICNLSTLKMTSAWVFFFSFSVEKCVIIFYKLNSIRVSRLVTVYITLRDGFRKFSTPRLSSSSPRLLLTTKLVPAFVIFLSLLILSDNNNIALGVVRAVWIPLGGTLQEESFCNRMQRKMTCVRVTLISWHSETNTLNT